MDYNITSRNSLEIAKQSVIKIYYNISFQRSYDDEFSSHLANKKFVQCSPAYITWLLGEFIYKLYNHDQFYDFDKTINNLQSYIYFLDDELQQILYDCLGVYYKNIYVYDVSLECFEKGLSKSVLETTEAMIRYHLAMILTDKARLFESLSHINKAKNLFDIHLNFKRSIMCSSELGLIYSKLGNYQYAEDIYLQCIKSTKTIPCSQWDTIVMYNNLLWNYMFAKEYDKIIEYETIVKEIAPNDPDMHSYIAYAYLRKSHIKKAKEVLKISKKNIEDSSVNNKYFIYALNSILLDKPLATLENKLLDMYNSAIKNFDYQMQLFSLKLLVECCEKHGDIEKQVDYMKKIIEILENRH